MIIAHVDLDAFFAAVEQRDRPQLRGRPVVIGADPKGGRGRGVVATCSYEARRFGIHSAMPISQAYRRCPQAVYLPPDGRKYSAVSRQVFSILQELTPLVEPVSIDEAFLDITGSWHLFGSPVGAARRLKDRIKEETGLTASVGIAPVKMAAKIASDVCKPDGLLEVTAEGLQDFLWPLPVGRLWGVGPKTEAALLTRGIRTVGDLARRDLAGLESAFGEHGRHLYALANGIDPRTVSEDDEIKSVSHEHTFDVDSESPDEVRHVLLALSEKVSHRLRRYGLKGRMVSIKIRLKGFHTYTRAVTLPERTNYTDDLYRVAGELFERFYRRGMAVRLIGLRVAQFEDDYVQDSLFHDAREEQLENLHTVVDRIKTKFGEKAIHRAG